MGITYKDSGVDIEKGEKAVDRIKSHARATFSSLVLSNLGTFGAAYRLPVEDYKKPVLVSSVDGVGTKLKIAFLTDIHTSVGQDIVNHCVNDILTTGAVPIYFLDYIATGIIDPEKIEKVVEGMSIACKKNGCSLIGGEMAEMPDFYSPGEYDICGAITGVVEEEFLLTSERIHKGDILIGIPSSGLHTNGYSLARKILLTQWKVNQYLDDLGCTIGEELLKIHRSYLNILRPKLKEKSLHGISHITGGGIEGNTRRILPEGLSLSIDWNAWEWLPIFKIIQETGDIETSEMRRVFNLGIGLIIVVEKSSADQWVTYLGKCREKPVIVGEIV